jgi:hypothetical protein
MSLQGLLDLDRLMGRLVLVRLSGQGSAAERDETGDGRHDRGSAERGRGLPALGVHGSP